MKYEEPMAALSPLLREGIDWVVRRKSGAFTLSDEADLRRWRELSPAHDEAYRHAAALGQMMREAGREWLDEHAQTPDKVVPLKRPVVSRRTVLVGTMAASVAGGLVVGHTLGLLPISRGRTRDYATATGERRTVTLSEGLKLELDAKTRMAVDNTIPNRVALIAGRAGVEARLSPEAGAAILAGKGEIRAHDARFDVQFDDGKACVTCLEGSLILAHGGTQLPIGPRQQLIYTAREIGQPVSVDPVEASAWKNGQLIFRQAPLSEVVRQVNRYREGRVVLASDAIGQRLFNGVFYTAKIEDAIPQIVQITGVRAVRLPGDVILLS